MKDWRIIFDLDDTLYPEIDYVYSGFAAVGRWVEENYGWSGFYHEALRVFGMGERTRVFNLVLDTGGISYGDEEVKKLVRIYREHTPNINLFPGVNDVLESLKLFPMGLITDGYLKVQRQKVEALEISDRLSSIVYSDSWGREGWKPSFTPYRQSMMDLGGNPKQFVYVADNAQKDFVSAKILGWFTIQVERDSGIYHGVNVPKTHQADVIVSDLSQIPFVLSEISLDRRLSSL